MNATGALALIGVFIALQATFSAAEVAIPGAERARLQASPSGGRALALVEHPSLLHGATALGQAIGTAGAVTLGVLLAAETLSAPLVGLLLLPLTFLLGRLLPRSLARAHAEKLAPALAVPVSWLAALLSPLARLLERATGEAGRQTVTREELRHLLEEGPDVGTQAEDRAMIQRVFGLSEILSRDVMVPLSAVDSVSRGATCAEAARRMVESGHSRLPVYKDRIDRVTGIVLHHDLLLVTDWSAPVSRVMRPAFFVPETKRVDQLFAELRRSRQRLAVVVDEYGGAIGILTVEDVLELVVGEIEDESDPTEALIRRAGQAEWLAAGRAPVDQVWESTGLRLPPGDYETVAGYLLHALGRVPRVGERVLVDGYTLTVARASERAVIEVSIRSNRGVRQPPEGGLR